VSDPKNPLYNFILGNAYEDLGQTASAVSFYLRTAELSNDDLLSYESLLKVSLCLERQGSRVFVTKGVLLRAIALAPSRPEAYFLIARLCERNKLWNEGYAYSCIGENLSVYADKLRTNVEYPGKYGFTFERAVSAWWVGLYDESLHLFRKLRRNPDVTDIYKTSVENNLQNLSNAWKDPLSYDDSLYEKVKVKFPGLKEIKSNYSQCYQDLFVLTMLSGKRNGRFLEIGCGDPFFGNNTALLEKNFDWTGISIDIDQAAIDKFRISRKNKAICTDATKVDYEKILELGDYDYLQIDCDPANISLNVLLRIPFEQHRFAVITFEHDNYADDHSFIKERAGKYLESFGYRLIVNDIAPDKYMAFEDWYIHPELVDSDIIKRMECISDFIKKADDYMLFK
jgi:tetratricopeptide (TPR) repeat protein